MREMEEGIFQKRCAISLLYCLGMAVQQDEVTLPNFGEAILGVCELLDHLLEKDETALENVLQTVRGE